MEAGNRKVEARLSRTDERDFGAGLDRDSNLRVFGSQRHA